MTLLDYKNVDGGTEVLPEDKIVNGQTLNGEDTKDLFGELEIRPWRFGVRMAAAFIRASQGYRALEILEELIENSENGTKLEKVNLFSPSENVAAAKKLISKLFGRDGFTE